MTPEWQQAVADLRRVVAAMAERLLEYAGTDVERMPMLEGDEGAVVFVHAKSCCGSCDYGCGAVSIMYAREDDDSVTISEVDHGDIRVRGLERP